MSYGKVVIASIGLVFALAAYGQNAEIEGVEKVKIDVPSLSGGTMDPNVLDVTSNPLLALPPSNNPEEAEASGDRLDSSGDFVINATTGPQCATPTGPLPPPGWTLTYANNVATCSYPYTSGYYSVCFGPNHYCFNQVSYTSYHDIPVGGTLRFCSVIGVPAGWNVIQTNLSASCPGSGQDWVMQHTSCVAGDSNCYPQSASITASPQTVTVPYGSASGATTVSWNTSNYSNPCVWIQNTGGPQQLWACSGGGAHSSVWSYVPAGGTTTLWISSGGSSSSTPRVAQVTVTGIAGTAPTISASPMSVPIPAGSSNGSTTVSYNLSGSGYNAMCLWIQNNGGEKKVWGCSAGLTRTDVWPYVPRGGTTKIWLSPNQTSPSPELASVTVTGQP